MENPDSRRSVVNKYLLIIHVLLFATLGTYRARSKMSSGVFLIYRIFTVTQYSYIMSSPLSVHIETYY